MKLAICDNEKNDLLQIKKLVLEYLKKIIIFLKFLLIKTTKSCSTALMILIILF